MGDLKRAAAFTAIRERLGKLVPRLAFTRRDGAERERGPLAPISEFPATTIAEHRENAA